MIGFAPENSPDSRVWGPNEKGSLETLPLCGTQMLVAAFLILISHKVYFSTTMACFRVISGDTFSRPPPPPPFSFRQIPGDGGLRFPRFSCRRRSPRRTRTRRTMRRRSPNHRPPRPRSRARPASIRAETPSRGRGGSVSGWAVPLLVGFLGGALGFVGLLVFGSLLFGGP